MFGSILKGAASLARGAVSVARSASGSVLSVPGVRTAVKATGIGATALTLGDMFTAGTKTGGLPALPNLAGAPLAPGGLVPGMGERGWFSNDPNIPDFLKPFAISKGNLKAYYRGPKGTVIVYDSVGDPYALDRRLAMRFKLWKPGHKPPISVGDWQAVKKADRTVKKMRKVFRMTTSVDKHISGGKVVVRRKKKGAS